MDDTYTQVLGVIQKHRQNQAGAILYAIPVEDLLDLPVYNPLRELIADRAEEAGIAAGLIDPHDGSFFDTHHIQVTIQGKLVVAELVEVAPIEPTESQDDPGEHFMDADGMPSERDLYDDMEEGMPEGDPNFDMMIM